MITGLYDVVYNGCDYDRAREFLEPDYREHNLVLGDGIAASIAHQRELGGYPNTILREVIDPPFHVVHVKYWYEPYDLATIDIWRLNAAGRAVEHWDSLMAIVGSDADSAVDGPRCAPTALSPEQRSARVATLRQLFDEGYWCKDAAAIAALLAPDFRDHSPDYGWFPPLRDMPASEVRLSELRLCGAGGDMAYSFADYVWKERKRHVAQLWRFDSSGLIAEHWHSANWQPRDAPMVPRARKPEEIRGLRPPESLEK